MSMFERQVFDLERYVKERATTPCFICAMLAGDPALRHHIIAEDEETIHFLSKYPTLPG